MTTDTRAVGKPLPKINVRKKTPHSRYKVQYQLE